MGVNGTFCPEYDRSESPFVYLVHMADQDAPELESLLRPERVAFERYNRFSGYQADVQNVALAL